MTILNLIIFSSLYYIFFSLIISYLRKNLLLTDDQYNKPQAYHNSPTPLAGGLVILFYIISINLMVNYDSFLNSIAVVSLIFFLIGFLDDIKLIVKPKVRLIIQILASLFTVFYFNIFVNTTSIYYLDLLLDIPYLATIFTVICILFIINGSNFIDGFNGLLGFYALSVLSILFYLNFSNSNVNFANEILICLFAVLTFLLFNFPNGKIFLGDSGSYLLGIIISFFAIKSSLADINVSPVFYAIILYYPFYESLFSFIRKLFYDKSSPFYPDKNHLHMIIYRILKNSFNFKQHSNYMAAVVCNVLYLLSIFPSFLFYRSDLYCLIYLMFILIFYSILYFFIRAYDK